MQIVAFLVGVVLVAVLVWQLGRDTRRDVRDGLSAAQTVAGLMLILLGIAWYLQERPDAPRVELGITAHAYPLDDTKVLVRAALTFRNNGRAAMPLEKDAFATFNVLRITPFDPAAVEAQLAGPPREGAPREIQAPRFAAIRQDRLKLDSMLETGEPDSIDYFTILDCESEQRVLIQASMPKPLQAYEKVLVGIGLQVPNSVKAPQVWVTETLLDLTDVCNGKPKGGTKE